ncbi:hypothetical protein ACFC36_15860 [Streptomyces rubiginosohelvolus]|uniref:hypothetical protein n=1 Tax=Streptomyces rubiginosohelvolus TaxID=67362 RepID=UPI0035E04A5E
MPAFWTPRRVLAYLRMQRRFEPYDIADLAFEQAGAADGAPDMAYVEISAFGFRAQAHGKTGFAALRAIREEHPALARSVYAYLAVMSLLAVLALGTVVAR